MNSLHPLEDRGFLIRAKGEYYGNIPPDKSYKRCSAVIFQEFCPTTKLGYDIMISWLQKSIRRGMEREACYVAIHLAEMRGIFLSNLLNRLMVILSEDVGPADPAIAQRLYPLYMNIKENRPKTGVLRDTETISPTQKAALFEIVLGLAKARKSRIADWHIHSGHVGEKRGDENEGNEDANEEENGEGDEEGNGEGHGEGHGDEDDYDWQPLNELLEEFHEICHHIDGNPVERSSEAMRIVENVLSIKEKLPWGTCREPAKRRPVWLIWEILTEVCSTEEMKALKGLYVARNDLLHLAHAVCLVTYQQCLPPITRAQPPSFSPSEALKRWEVELQANLPVLNDAIDRHTREGRNLLGRDMLFFLERGVHLENHYVFPGELEILENWKKEERNKEENFAEKEPRPYQRPIVEATKAYFARESEGTLHMACGTGKTLTSFWVAHTLVKEQLCANFMRLLVITPRLQVLGQFYRTYRDSFIQHGIKTVVGVICSDFSRPKPHDLCYHEHIRNHKELAAFWNRYVKGTNHGYGAVVLFTTYRSLGKVRSLTEIERPLIVEEAGEDEGGPALDPFWDLVIYDEGHHMNSVKHSLSAHRRLLLSATPAGNQRVIHRYDYKMAIADGALVPYRLHLVPIVGEGDGDGGAQLPQLPKDIDNLMAPPQSQMRSEVEFIAHHILKCGTFRKLIVFSIDNGRSCELLEEFRAKYPEIPALYLDHKTRMKDRDPITRRWAKLDCGVFFNCSILGEGVDFPSVDAVYLESGHISETRVIQAAGRPLRLDPNKPDKVAHILMSYRDPKQYNKALGRLRYLV